MNAYIARCPHCDAEFFRPHDCAPRGNRIRSTRKWEIKHEPRQSGDKKPWIIKCPFEEPEWALYEQGSWCQCRRFKNGSKALSFYHRRIDTTPGGSSADV